MKELSIEEKAKRYDNRFEKAKKWYDSNTNEGYRGIFEDIFPELKESKDEKIKKVIYGWIYTQPSQFFDSGFSKEEMLAWIEKQGEQKATIEMKSAEESLGIDSNTYNKIVDECIYSKQKSDDVEEVNFFDDFRKTDSEVEPKFHEGDNIEPIDTCLGSPRTIYKICDGWYETNQGTLDFEFENNWRLVEQKPAWSEEDDKILKSIIINIENLQFSEDMREKYHHIPNANKSYYQIKIDWLKSIKERVVPQQKQGWSEEDKEVINLLLELIYEQDKISPRIPSNEKRKMMLSWLKSLKDRYTWKPSEEQMRVLDLAIRCGINRGTTEETTLVSLFNDLKKLI